MPNTQNKKGIEHAENSKSSMPKSEFKEAKPIAVYLLCAFAFVFSLALTLLISGSISKVKTVDVSEFTIANAQNFVFDYILSNEEDRFVLSGTVYKNNERIYTANNFLALYNKSTSEYYKAPTAMSLDYDIENEIEGGAMYSRGGLYAFALKSDLTGDFSNYEICFLYQNNDNKLLVHTGEYLY